MGVEGSGSQAPRPRGRVWSECLQLILPCAVLIMLLFHTALAFQTGLG